MKRVALLLLTTLSACASTVPKTEMVTDNAGTSYPADVVAYCDTDETPILARDCAARGGQIRGQTKSTPIKTWQEQMMEDAKQGKATCDTECLARVNIAIEKKRSEEQSRQTPVVVTVPTVRYVPPIFSRHGQWVTDYKTVTVQ